MNQINNINSRDMMLNEKCIIRIAAIILFLLLPLISSANNWEYKLEDAMIEKVDDKGKKSIL